MPRRLDWDKAKQRPSRIKSDRPAIWKVAAALALYTLLATMPLCRLLGPSLGAGTWLAAMPVSLAAGEVFSRRWHPLL